MVKPTSLSAWKTSATMWCAVLVADHRDEGNLGEQDRPVLAVCFGELGVESFEYALTDTGCLPHPGRRREDEDVGRENFVADGWPLVAVAHVLVDAGLDVVADDPDRLVGDTVLLQFRLDVLGDELAARGRR
jgi:hypothetical protein